MEKLILCALCIDSGPVGQRRRARGNRACAVSELRKRRTVLDLVKGNMKYHTLNAVTFNLFKLRQPCIFSAKILSLSFLFPALDWFELFFSLAKYYLYFLNSSSVLVGQQGVLSI